MASLPIWDPSPQDPQAYPIVETFHSIQGEGVWTGSNAFFIRLGGCDVGCPWCDTKHSWPQHRHPQRGIPELISEVLAARPHLVILTGGEPLLHNLDPLTQALREAGQRIHLETSGSHPLLGQRGWDQFDWITLSPKPFKVPDPGIYPHVHELKVVIAQPEDLAWAEHQATQVPAHTLKSLQPEWSDPRQREIAITFVLAHPEWRLSLQTHKMLGVR